MADKLNITTEQIQNALANLTPEKRLALIQAAQQSGLPVAKTEPLSFFPDGSMKIVLHISRDTVEYFRGQWETSGAKSNQEIYDYILPMIMSAVDGSPFVSFGEEEPPVAATTTIPVGTKA